MAPIAQPTFKPASISVTGASTPLITNLSLPVQDTEYSHSLSTYLRQFSIESRNGGTLKIAFISGESGINYLTIHKKTNFTISDLSFVGITLYIQSSVNNDVAEILELF